MKQYCIREQLIINSVGIIQCIFKGRETYNKCIDDLVHNDELNAELKVLLKFMLDNFDNNIKMTSLPSRNVLVIQELFKLIITLFELGEVHVKRYLNGMQNSLDRTDRKHYTEMSKTIQNINDLFIIIKEYQKSNIMAFGNGEDDTYYDVFV
jgi:hypothetical protein